MRRAEGAAERGFSYLEVMVATAITIGVVLTAAGAVANTLHAAAVAEQKMALEDDALNALADVRAIVAYGDGNPADGPSQLLPRLFGRTSTQIRALPDGSVETISIAIDAQRPGATQSVAQATASADGASVTERQVLYYEAPAPGSSVTER
jgi:type II secretory pathway pseudopilin PulG